MLYKIICLVINFMRPNYSVMRYGSYAEVHTVIELIRFLTELIHKLHELIRDK